MASFPLRARRPTYRTFVLGILALIAITLVVIVTRFAAPPPSAATLYSFPPGADPSISAQMGGNGFEQIAAEQGWQTGSIAPEDFRFIADTGAIKGGEFAIGIDQLPATFRAYGKDENVAETRMVYNLVYEGLLTIHPVTLEFLPSLASHWKISPDGRTFTFRINPAARFSDGHPVTSNDVIATWQLGIDPGIVSESTNEFFEGFERPVALGPYIVSVTARTDGWRNLLYVGGTPILPAHVIGKISGEEYLSQYQYRMPPGSGPYILVNENIVERGEVRLQRRADWWGRELPLSRGQYNFDRIRMIDFPSDSLAMEAFRTGMIDFCNCHTVAYQIGEFGLDEVNRGMILTRKVYNDAPVGFSGLAFNTERAPFDDIRIRKAIALLFDRQKYIEHQVNTAPELIGSMFHGSEFANPRNPRQMYDREQALRLLAEAGYDSRNDEGALVRDDQPLEIEFLIYPGQEWFAEILAEDLLGAGIWLTTQSIDENSWFSRLKDRNYQMAHMGWGGLIFPNPETTIHSSLADFTSNNITAFRNARVDTLIERERKSFDGVERRTMLREIDSIFTASYHYAYSWTVPYERLIHTNRFGMPRFVLGRIGDWRDILSLWWVDPEKQRAFMRALDDPTVNLQPRGRLEDRFWQTWSGKGIEDPKPRENGAKTDVLSSAPDEPGLPGDFLLDGAS